MSFLFFWGGRVVTDSAAWDSRCRVQRSWTLTVDRVCVWSKAAASSECLRVVIGDVKLGGFPSLG